MSLKKQGLSELHLHLDGSLRLSTLQELAQEEGVTLPNNLTFYQGMGLQEALDRFATTLSVLQRREQVRRVASEICEDAEKNGVTTLEIRFAPQLHKAASMGEIIDAALEGINGRAGLILCGLYGEPPKLLEELVELAETRYGVVALDLAGGPSSGDDWSMKDYVPAFSKARDIGLGRTIHAGEGRPPEEIRTAINMLHAQRIGHGTTLLQDPSVVELVLEKGITIEACATSNMHTGAIPEVNAHPIPTWLDMGIKVCICADNTLLSDVSTKQEVERVAGIPGMTEEKVQKAIDVGHLARFVRSI